MSVSDCAVQFLADVLDAPVDRPDGQEPTSLGAAQLAGLAAGLYPAPDEFAAGWAAERRFAPSMPAEARRSKYQR